MSRLLIAAAEQARLSSQEPVFLLGKPLLKGTKDLGYFGEFTSSEVATGAAIHALAGMNTTNSMNSTAGWLGFAYQGKHLLVAKKPIRHSVSLASLNTQGVRDGSKVVTIVNHQFRLRLIRGGDANPAAGPGGEWDALIYPIVDGRWASFSLIDLGAGVERGGWTWCMEQKKDQVNPYWYLQRGYGAVENFQLVENNSQNSNGWRPILELID